MNIKCFARFMLRALFHTNAQHCRTFHAHWEGGLMPHYTFNHLTRIFLNLAFQSLCDANEDFYNYYILSYTQASIRSIFYIT